MNVDTKQTDDIEVDIENEIGRALLLTIKTFIE